MNADKLMGEEWARVPGYDGHYMASTLGRIKSLPRKTPAGWRGGKVLQGRVCDGYIRMCLSWNDGRQFDVRAHRLVMLAFRGPPKPGQICRHLNGERADNRLRNLRYGTHSENEQDKRRHGRSLQGEKHHKAKFTSMMVRVIRRLMGSITQRDAAVIFGMSQGNVHLIQKGKTWTHLS
jgi:hypothetical protein